MSDDSGYGLWSLVVINSVIFILFAYTFFKPHTGRVTGAHLGRSAPS
jgi:methanethiol S-methyltransferase